MNKNQFFITILMLFSIYQLAAQQAWTQKQQEAYIQLGTSFFNYSTTYDDGFNAADIPRPISETIISLYAEYGITNTLTVTATLPVHFISSGNLDESWMGFSPEKGNISNLGNPSIALTYNFYKKNNLVLSSKLTSTLNTSKYDAATGLRTGFDASIFSPTILIGIGTNTFFASAETGFSFLTNNYANRYIFNAQIGKDFTPNKKITGILAISSSVALGNPSDTENIIIDENAIYTALYQNEQTYYAATLKAGYKITTNLSVWLSAAGGIAKNLGRAGVYSISFGYNLR